MSAVLRDDPRAATLQQLVEGALAEGRAEGRAEGCAEGCAEGRAEGEARGRAVALLGFLASRGIDVSDEARERIVSCTDLGQIETWIGRSGTVTTVKELFE